MRKTAKERKTIKNTTTYKNDEMENFIKILTILVILVTVFWLITLFVTSKTKKDKAAASTTIQYTKILAGSILNREEETYYVLVEAKDDENLSSYSNLITDYRKKDGHLGFYEVDLSDQFNSTYVSDKSNLKVNKVSDMKFSETVLLKIDNKKVVDIITGNEKITSYITNLKNA